MWRNDWKLIFNEKDGDEEVWSQAAGGTLREVHEQGKEVGL